MDEATDAGVTRINLAREDPVTLRLVLECARTGSLTAAARRCHVSLSTASRRIALFEEGVGVPLFRRHRRGVSTTGAGQEVVRAAHRITEAIGDMDRALELWRAERARAECPRPAPGAPRWCAAG